MPKFDADFELLRTPHFYEADLLIDSLSKASIPYYRDVENFSGISQAVAMPWGGGPGIVFRVVVPGALQKRAQAILDNLPIIQDPNPPFWGFNSSGFAKTWVKIGAWAYFAFFGLSVMVSVVRLIISVFR
jgi:hypothetical protein